MLVANSIKATCIICAFELECSSTIKILLCVTPCKHILIIVVFVSLLKQRVYKYIKIGFNS